MKKTISYKKDLSEIRLTVDYEEDLVVIKKILNKLSKKNHYHFNDIIKSYSDRNSDKNTRRFIIIFE